jgi:hypothetical protein
MPEGLEQGTAGSREMECERAASWAPESSVRNPTTGVHHACRSLMRKVESWLSDEEFGDRMITWTSVGTTVGPCGSS